LIVIPYQIYPLATEGAVTIVAVYPEEAVPN